ncbi:MAG: hypothetical protein DRJ49_07430 [Thermoprotei archaeon]|nr:MAG: hypothetical protein DRJ49_07430 [Thermoprotei archaeon]
MKAKRILIITVGLIFLLPMLVQIIGHPETCHLYDVDTEICILSDFWVEAWVEGDGFCYSSPPSSYPICYLLCIESGVDHSSVTDKDCWTASYGPDGDWADYTDGQICKYCRWIVINVEPKPECPGAPSCSNTACACIDAYDCIRG